MARTLGEFIAEKRKKKQIPLRKFANDIKISAAYLSDLENGNRPFPSTGKGEELFGEIIKILDLTDEEIEEFTHLKDLSMLETNHISQEMVAYMKSVPMAQTALRRAKDNNLTDADWEKIIEEISRKEK